MRPKKNTWNSSFVVVCMVCVIVTIRILKPSGIPSDTANFGVFSTDSTTEPSSWLERFPLSAFVLDDVQKINSRLKYLEGLSTLSGAASLPPQLTRYLTWKQTLPLPNSWEYSPYVNKAPPFVFCTIAKNSCSQYKSLLQRLMGEPDYLRMSIVHRIPGLDAYLRIAQMSDHEAANLLFNENIPKFAVVRNPIVRTLSAYRDKIEYHLPKEQHGQQGFEAFVYQQFQHLPPPNQSCKAWLHIDQHWRPQICQCGFLAEQHLFSVYKFENNSALLDRLEGIVDTSIWSTGWGKDGSASFRDNFSKNQKSGHSKGTDQKVLEYYTVQLLDFVAEKLAPDIDRLGYREEVEELRAELLRREQIHSS